MKPKHMAPDWPTMIEDLQNLGRTQVEICAAMGFGPSDSIIRNYKRGVQPIYHRGERLIDIWCEAMVKTRTDVPRIPVHQPYRVPARVALEQKRAMDAAALSLPAFPVPQPMPGVMKRGPGRPKKLRAAA